MGKKSKRTKASSHGEDRVAPSLRKQQVETADNLHFEDPFVDEVEEDYVEDTPYGETGEDEDAMERVQAWNPLTGQALNSGENLEMDPSAYKMYHALTPEWPSLTFDFLRDDLGESRTRFPHSLTVAVGTQAPEEDENKLTIMKMSDLSRIHVETEDDILGEEYNPNAKVDAADDDSDSADELELDPVLEHFSIPHDGGINRIRVMPQQSDIIATWGASGNVNVFNVEPILAKFSGGSQEKASVSSLANNLKPFYVYNTHEVEGYAMDWSSVKQGYMVTGDCAGKMHLWTPRPEGSFEVTTSYDSHGDGASVEDLQWSPTEGSVFCAAECGGYVRIFDTRAQSRAMLSHKVHSNGADVNVVSWNKLVANLLASGGDDGVLSVWDLRHFSSSTPSPLARFTAHKTPITSVEWHPTDESMLAASDDVGAYVYDLSVEEDDNAGEVDVPPQLLFVHCGSEQFKEVHWHPQISSCLMTTALSGYSVFIPSNL